MTSAPDGRTLRWRLGMIVAGALLIGTGAALIYWPQLLGWIVASALGLFGVLCVTSAMLAKGRR